MKSRLLIIAAAAIPVTLAAASGTAQAQSNELIWRPELAVANGSGCRLQNGVGDPVVVAFGSTVSVLFGLMGVDSLMGVDLPAGGPNQRLADIKNCSVRIPVTIPRGYYIVELTQTLTYGVNKTHGSSGKITTLDSILDSSVGSLSVAIPRGSIQQPALTESKTRYLRIEACGASSRSGFYRTDVATSGQRDSSRETFILRAEGVDIHYDIKCRTRACFIH